MVSLPKVEDFEKMTKFLEDSVNKYDADNTQFHADINEHNEIIRRYDEVLIQKGSRHELKISEDKASK